MKKDVKEISYHQMNRIIGTRAIKFRNYLKELRKKDSFSDEMNQGFHIGILSIIFIEYLNAESPKEIDCNSAFYTNKSFDKIEEKKNFIEERLNHFLKHIPKHICDKVYELSEGISDIKYNKEKDTEFDIKHEGTYNIRPDLKEENPEIDIKNIKKKLELEMGPEKWKAINSVFGKLEQDLKETPEKSIKIEFNKD